MKSGKKRKRLASLFFINGTLILLILIWTIPTVGIFVSSFRARDNIATSGWWSVLPHRELDDSDRRNFRLFFSRQG